MSSTTNQSMQGLENTPLTLYTTAENIELDWTFMWGGLNGDYGRGVAMDVDGNLYCVGTTESFGAGRSDLALVKFASTGAKLWNTTWDLAGDEVCHGVAVDASGSVYCVGETFMYGSEFVLLKFFSNGTFAWYRTWGGENADIGYSVALDANGDIYCLGETNSFGAGVSDLALVKFASDGTYLWNTTWGGTGEDVGYSIVVDASGSVYCVALATTAGVNVVQLALLKFGFPSSGGIFGFGFLYLLFGLLALVYLVHRRKSSHTLI